MNYSIDKWLAEDRKRQEFDEKLDSERKLKTRKLQKTCLHIDLKKQYYFRDFIDIKSYIDLIDWKLNKKKDKLIEFIKLMLYRHNPFAVVWFITDDRKIYKKIMLRKNKPNAACYSHGRVCHFVNRREEGGGINVEHMANILMEIDDERDNKKWEKKWEEGDKWKQALAKSSGKGYNPIYNKLTSIEADKIAFN